MNSRESVYLSQMLRFDAMNFHLNKVIIITNEHYWSTKGKTKITFYLINKTSIKSVILTKVLPFYLIHLKWCPCSCNSSSFSFAVLWKEFEFFNNDFILSRSLKFSVSYANPSASSWSSLIVPVSRLFFLFSSVTSSSISFRFLDFSSSLMFFYFCSAQKQYIIVFLIWHYDVMLVK